MLPQKYPKAHKFAFQAEFAVAVNDLAKITPYSMGESWEKTRSMPREDRRIIFSFDETYKAIYSLCMQKDMKRPPPGAIAEIAIDTGDKNKLTVKIANVHEDTEHQIDYSRDFLAAALMLYCRSHSIPISKKASKSVDFKPDSVILRLVI